MSLAYLLIYTITPLSNEKKDYQEANFITAIIIAAAISTTVAVAEQQRKAASTAQSEAKKSAAAQKAAEQQAALQAGEYWNELGAEQMTLQSLQNTTKMLSTIIEEKQKAKTTQQPTPIIFAAPPAETNIIDKINGQIQKFFT